MRADPRGPATLLSEAPLSEIVELLRLYTDEEHLLRRRGSAIEEMRRRGLSWRKISDLTDVPHSTARRWLRMYLELA